MVLSLIAALVAIMIVGSVIMPSITSPTLPVLNTSTNATKLSNINTTKQHNFTLSNIDTAQAASIDVSFAGLPSGTNIGVDIGATHLGNFTNASTSPQTFSIPAGTVATLTTVTYTSNQATTSTGNVTSSTINYYQNASSSTWDPSVQIFWSVLLGIVVVAALIIYLARLF